MLDRLEQIVGPSHVLTDPGVVSGYARDLTGRWGAPPRAVIRPGSVEEVAAVVAWCNAQRVPLVPQGGNTGLVGGGVPRAGQLVLSLRRLDAIGPVDRVAAQLTAAAGATLEAVQLAANDAGLAFGVDFAARSAATVGGMIATDAGGAQALRHGTMRAQVAGLEAVLSDGRIIRRLDGLLKDTAGYNVPQLLIGSEGTLGVITAARLKLVPAVPSPVVALIAVPDTESAVELMIELRPRAHAIELLYREGLELVCAHRRLALPLHTKHDVFVLTEVESLDDLATITHEDVAIAEDADRRAALWAYRDLANEAIAAQGVPHKLDVTVPLAEIAAFIAALPAVIVPHRLILFGHLGDGNLHVNVLGPPADDESVDEAVLQLVAEHRGSISAEHGVGVAKRKWLSLTRDQAEIDAMRAIKRALDPNGILNPGAVL